MRTSKTWLMILVLWGLALPALAGTNVVTWSARLDPADAHVGEGGQLVVTAQIDPGWHIYSLTQGKGGPEKTVLEVPANKALTVEGKPAQPAFQKGRDPNFGAGGLDVETFENTVSFGLPVQLKDGVTGPQNLVVRVRYQACDAHSCQPPKTEEIPLAFSVSPEATRAEHLYPITDVPAQGGAAVASSGGAPQAPAATVAAGAPGAATGSYTQEVEKAKQQGLLSFLLFAFGAGFLALLTPCVFPMIPITVSFFSKRSQDAPGQGVKGALAYCAGIVGTFTGLGLLMTLLFGASGIQKLATNPYLNLALTLLFVLLGLNLMGAYEIPVPAGLVNRFQSGRNRGGFLGPMAMGLTFTLTSFTCTVAFVGTLLAAAAQGSWLYPIIGMLAFSTAFSLPFFLLALFPQYLARLPKSGNWLVTVKAFMGFLEFAAALKFLSNADLVWQLGLLTRPIFLAIWFGIFLLAGLYLQGWILLPHDKAMKYGVGRRVVGGLAMAISLYCLAAMEGAPLKDFAAFLPPNPYPGKEVASNGGANDAWISDYNKALALAKAQNKPVFVNFTGVTCTNCRWMEQNMFPRDEVKSALASYVKAEIYTDRKGDEPNRDLQLKLSGVVTLPVYVIVSPDGKPLSNFQGSTSDANAFVAFLKKGQSAGIATASR